MGTILLFGMVKDHQATNTFPIGQLVWNLILQGVPKEITDVTRSYLGLFI